MPSTTMEKSSVLLALSSKFLDANLLKYEGI